MAFTTTPLRLIFASPLRWWLWPTVPILLAESASKLALVALSPSEPLWWVCLAGEAPVSRLLSSSHYARVFVGGKRFLFIHTA